MSEKYYHFLLYDSSGAPFSWHTDVEDVWGSPCRFTVSSP